MVAGCGSGASRDGTPQCHECRNVERWPAELGHEHVRWDLEGNVSDEENTERRLVLLILQLEVSDQTVVTSG